MSRDLYARMLVTTDTKRERDDDAERPGGARRWLAALRQLWAAAFARTRGEDGFTLIEALMAAVILVVGLIGLLGLLDTSVKASALTRAREGATGLAREILEDARTIPYAQIIPTSIESQLQAMNGLADGSSSTAGWQIDRRGFTYTVMVKECAIDNPKDGLAETHGSTFCSGQENGTGDTEPEDLKRITVEVSWTFQKRTSAVTQISTLTAAGQAIGLIATKLQLSNPTCPSTLVCVGSSTEPVIEGKETKALTFSVSFPEGTSAISWSLEGAKQEEMRPASTDTSLTFSWTINEPAKGIYVSDGTYQVSAQAVNSTGVIGPPISIPIRLIRGTPAEPGGIIGGFNTVYRGGVATEVAELQWKANAERNVIGYRVYGPSHELVCPESLEKLSTTTSCIDFGASGKPAERAYTVVALYRNASNEVTEGPAGSAKATQTESMPPSAPTNLVATKNADGSVTLKWEAPTGGTPPSFYRIYRAAESCGPISTYPNYTCRYGETASTEYKDTEAATTHEYWVTAVGPHLTESPFLGPVSA